jgi:hypothetical protein
LAASPLWLQIAADTFGLPQPAAESIEGSARGGAILALVNDGYLSGEKSKGTIVTNPTGWMRFVGSLMSFSEEMGRKNIPHSSQVLEQKIVSANDVVADVVVPAFKDGIPIQLAPPANRIGTNCTFIKRSD